MLDIVTQPDARHCDCLRVSDGHLCFAATWLTVAMMADSWNCLTAGMQYSIDLCFGNGARSSGAAETSDRDL